MAYYPLSSADILHHLSSCPSYLHSGLSPSYFHLSSSPFTTPTYQPEPPPRANLLPCPPPKPPDPFPFLSTSHIYSQPPHTHQILQPHPPWQEFTKEFTSISPPARELLQHRDELLRSPSRTATPSLAPPRAPPWSPPPPTSDPIPNLPPLPPIGVSEKGETILPQPTPATAISIPATAAQPPPALDPPFSPSNLASDETKEKEEERSTPPREPPRTPRSPPQASPWQRPSPTGKSTRFAPPSATQHAGPATAPRATVPSPHAAAVLDATAEVVLVGSTEKGERRDASEKQNDHTFGFNFLFRGWLEKKFGSELHFGKTSSRWFVDVAMPLDSNTQSKPSIKSPNGSPPFTESTIHVLLHLPLLSCHVALSHVMLLHFLNDYYVALQHDRMVLPGGAELGQLVNNFGPFNTYYILGPNFNFEDKKTCDQEDNLLLFELHKEFNLEDKVDFQGVRNDRGLDQRKIKRIIGPMWREGVG